MEKTKQDEFKFERIGEMVGVTQISKYRNYG